MGERLINTMDKTRKGNPQTVQTVVGKPWFAMSCFEGMIEKYLQRQLGRLWNIFLLTRASLYPSLHMRLHMPFALITPDMSAETVRSICCYNRKREHCSGISAFLAFPEGLLPWGNLAHTACSTQFCNFCAAAPC